MIVWEKPTRMHACINAECFRQFSSKIAEQYSLLLIYYSSPAVGNTNEPIKSRVNVQHCQLIFCQLILWYLLVANNLLGSTVRLAN